MKKLTLILLAALLALTLLACDKTPAGTNDTTDAQTNTNGEPAVTLPDGTTTQTPGTTAPTTVVLTFDGNQLSTSVQDTGIKVEGGAFVITRGGSYEFRGDLSNGQIRR